MCDEAGQISIMNDWSFLNRWFDPTRVRTHEAQIHDLPEQEKGALLIQSNYHLLYTWRNIKVDLQKHRICHCLPSVIYLEKYQSRLLKLTWDGWVPVIVTSR